MLINRREVITYPYHGCFYRQTEPDYSLPLDEREQREEMVYETDCDIQEVSKANNPILVATFSVFFPFDTTQEIPIRRGYRFEGSTNGMDISGEVTNVVLSQVGGIVCYCKDYDSDEVL